MIFFYQKSTGKVIGTVDGRVIPESVRQNVMVKPDNIDITDIGKYEITYEPIFVDGKVTEILPVECREKIIDIENGSLKALDSVLTFDEDGYLIDIGNQS